MTSVFVPSVSYPIQLRNVTMTTQIRKIEKNQQKSPIARRAELGDGRSTVVEWHLLMLTRADKEMSKLLTGDQCRHVTDQPRELARQNDPTRSDTVDVQPIDDFFEIRDKGGPLGKLNIRVFFFVHKPSRTIVVLGVIKKENDGSTRPHIKVEMKRRMHAYIEEHHSGK